MWGPIAPVMGQPTPGALRDAGGPACYLAKVEASLASPPRSKMEPRRGARLDGSSGEDGGRGLRGGNVRWGIKNTG